MTIHFMVVPATEGATRVHYCNIDYHHIIHYTEAKNYSVST
jgi:hypothetical protein